MNYNNIDPFLYNFYPNLKKDKDDFEINYKNNTTTIKQYYQYLIQKYNYNKDEVLSRIIKGQNVNICILFLNKGKVYLTSYMMPFPAEIKFISNNIYFLIKTVKYFGYHIFNQLRNDFPKSKIKYVTNQGKLITGLSIQL
jgi:hypothetical protein